MNKNPIGIFDSGVGGLTILKAVSELLPSENIIYFGDSAHIPYGTKSKEAVTKFSVEILKFLESKKVKLVIVACNTASALSLPTLQKIAKETVLGVIEPAAKKANETCKNGKIAVLATQATVKSKTYKKTLLKLNKNLKIFEFACPLLVPLIEDKTLLNKLLPQMLSFYLSPVKKSGADTLILGCTHYPIIKKQIAKALGPKVELIDSAQNVAIKVKDFLEGKNLLNKKGRGQIKVFASDDPKNFEQASKAILNKKNIKAQTPK